MPNTTGRHALSLAAPLLVAVVLAACSASTTPTPPPAGSGASPSPAASTPAGASASPGAASASPASGGNAVTIQGFAFAPPSLTVAVGTTVTWTNQDSTGHTVTADDGSFGSQTLSKSAAFSQTFATAGTFAYHCSIHPSMTGTIVVQ